MTRETTDPATAICRPVYTLAGLLAGLVVLLTLAGCQDRTSTANPARPAITAESGRALPASYASIVIDPAQGGVVALSDGAQVALPRESLSATAVVGLRAIDSAPGTPLPRSIIGRAYEFTLDSGRLTGLAMLRLPLPPDVTSDEYELGVYRWNGRGWERMRARLLDGAVQVGTDTPALYSVQGRWKPASAALALTQPLMKTLRSTVAISVTGQYRYSALPRMRDDYVPARLVLKLDSSGGAGQVTGNHELDQTLAETLLYFQPDRQQPDGVIDFAYLFQLAPGNLKISAGATGRLYAVLTVEDAAAPTRQASAAIDYVQMLPIEIVNGEVLRPALGSDTQQELRWHVELNGQTLMEKPATDPGLSLDGVLAGGGLGEYTIRLEAKQGVQWIPVSNEVSVTLALPGTRTPSAGEAAGTSGTPAISLSPGTSIETPTPALSPPPTPTRRARPTGITPTPTATASPTPNELAPTPTATRPAWASVFWADSYAIVPGECTTLYWNVQNVSAVYLNDIGVTGNETRRVCPSQTTIYNLRSVSDGKTQNWYVTITVQSGAQTGFEFTADAYEIPLGGCTTLRWKAVGVAGVYLDDTGVPGESSQQVCPDATTTYRLRVEASSGSSTTRQVTITVVPADKIVIGLWADQYTMHSGNCTTLYWSVENVQAVYLQGDGPERGVLGQSSEPICPSGAQVYAIRAEAQNGQTGTRQITVQAAEPSLSANEIIAQGVVRDVTRVDDVDSLNAGNQPGWNLLIDGVNTLFRGAGDCCQAAVTLQLPQALTDPAAGKPVDWPISPSQLLEFRATCSGATCSLAQGTSFYVRLRSG